MGSMMKRKGFRLFAMVLALVMVIGLVPVSAAKKKSVTVSNKTELFAAMQKSDVGTITYKTDKSGKLTISAKAGSETKKLVINAPKTKVTNKASFSSVVIKNAKSYTEKRSGNKIYASSKKLTISIASMLKASVICNKKSSSITLKAGRMATVDVTMSKKANLVVSGDKTAKVSVASQVKSSKITASVPVSVDAAKSMNVVLEKGAENSVINAKSDKVNVKVTNKSGKEPTMMVAGKAVTPATTPKPTAVVTATPTPTPTTTTTTGSGDVIIGYAPSSGGSSGGGSYSGGGSSSSGGGYSAPATDSTPTPEPVPANQFTVANETDLIAKLNELAADSETEYTVIFKTEETLTANIPEAAYANIIVEVDAPNATIKNKAAFKKVVIKNISKDTWEEYAGNNIVSSAANTHIIVGAGAVNTVIVLESGVVNANIENNGIGQSISGVSVNAANANVVLGGTNHIAYLVDNTALNNILTTSVQVTLRTTAAINMQVMAGGESSDVVLLNSEATLNLTGLGIITVVDVVTNSTYEVTAERISDAELAATQGKGSVIGKVVFADNTYAEGAVVKAYYYDNDLRATVSATPVAEATIGADGQYVFSDIDRCNYYLVYTLDGYKTVNRVLTLGASVVSLDDTVLIPDVIGTGSITGTLVDSTTGDSINTPGVLLKLREGLGNISGYVVSTTTTDETGNYAFSDVNIGTYTIQVADERSNSEGLYVRTYTNVYVAENGQITTKDITVNYQLVNTTEIVVGGEGELKFVLEWYDQKDDGSVPSDLDSHLIGPKVDTEKKFHVYYSNKKYNVDDESYADLDVDDTTYRGPETTTVRKSSDGMYHFYVYDFTDQDDEKNTKLSTSGAWVTVSKGSRWLATYYVPVGKEGTLWDVCTYDTTTNVLTPINVVYFHPGNSSNVGKSAAEIIREKAFTLNGFEDGESYISDYYSDLEDEIITIHGEEPSLTAPVFKFGNEETTYVYTAGSEEGYVGTVTATYNGETIVFKVRYVQQITAFNEILLEAETLVDQDYRTVYTAWRYDEDTDEDIEDYYYTTVYGEEIPTAMTVSFYREGVTGTYEPVSDQAYIGIVTATYKGITRTIRVFFEQRTNAFNYVELESESGSYSLNVSSHWIYDEEEDEDILEYYYVTIFAEDEPNIVAVSLDKEGATATYTPVSGQDYIGIINASYKSFTREIRVKYEFSTNAFNSMKIYANGMIDTESYYTDYDWDDNDDKYYFIEIEAISKPENLVVKFNNTGVIASYIPVSGEGYIGIIRASYKGIERDIRVYCYVTSYYECYFTYEFTDGVLTKKIWNWDDGAVDTEEYNNGYVIKGTETWYEDGTEYTDTYVYEYDVDGEMTKQTITYSGGTIEIIEYKDGLLYARTYEYTDGGSYTVLYDEDGYRVMEARSYANGNACVKEYEYDDEEDDNLLVKETVIDNNWSDLYLYVYQEEDDALKEKVKSKAATSGAIVFEYTYDGEEYDHYNRLNTNTKVYEYVDDVPQLLITADYSYNTYGTATKTVWTYEEGDISQIVWEFDNAAEPEFATKTIYYTDGTTESETGDKYDW